MKQQEIDLLAERVTRTVISSLRAELVGIQNGLDRNEGSRHADKETLLRRFTAMEEVLQAIPPKFERLDHNITGIRSCLERLERILEARATKALEAEDISRMVDATKPMLSHIMEATQPKSLSDQVDEIKALCDKLNLTIVIKSKEG